jgi:hypothetical protein
MNEIFTLGINSRNINRDNRSECLRVAACRFAVAVTCNPLLDAFLNAVAKSGCDWCSRLTCFTGR